MQTQCFDFKAIEKNKLITNLGTYTYDCEPIVSSINLMELQQLLQTKKIQLVDIREPEEHAVFNIGGINIPLSQVATDERLFGTDHTTIFYCASGINENHCKNASSNLSACSRLITPHSLTAVSRIGVKSLSDFIRK